MLPLRFGASSLQLISQGTRRRGGFKCLLRHFAGSNSFTFVHCYPIRKATFCLLTQVNAHCYWQDIVRMCVAEYTRNKRFDFVRTSLGWRLLYVLPMGFSRPSVLPLFVTFVVMEKGQRPVSPLPTDWPQSLRTISWRHCSTTPPPCRPTLDLFLRWTVPIFRALKKYECILWILPLHYLFLKSIKLNGYSSFSFYLINKERYCFFFISLKIFLIV